MSNKLPNGWKEYKLGEVIEIFGGGTPRTDVAEYWNGEIAWLSVADFNHGRKYVYDTEKKISKKGVQNSSTKMLKKGDIIISARGTVGAIAVLRKEMAFNQSCYGIRALENITTNDYIYYLIKDTVSDLLQIAHGGVFDTITKDTFNEIDILLPPLPEQRAIASVLSSLDDKIDLLHRENKTLEAMAETLFRQWFIEEAKDEWEEVPLSEVFDFKEGPGIRNWQYKDKGIPFINIRLISNGEIDVSKANFIDAVEANEKYNHFYLQRKDMVVSTSGTLGKTAIIRNYHLPLLLNTSVIRFRPKDGINYSFMYGYLKSRSFYECLMDSASGSVQLNFGPMHLKQIIMQIPPKEKLENFRKIADPIYEKIELNYFQIHTLEKLRDTLLPKLMSGEVRVKYEEEEMASCRA